MGIIKDQAIKSTILSYVGVLLGFITTGYFFPKYFSTEQNGLLKLLISYGFLLGQFANLGVVQLTAKIFPIFRNTEKKHNGFLFISFIFNLIGVILVTGIFLIISPYLIESNIEKSELLTKYLYFIIPLIFSVSFFNSLEAYNKSLFDSVSATFFRDVIQRGFILLFIILFIFNIINYHLFVILYIVAFVSPTFFIAILLWNRGSFSLSFEREFVTRELFKQMFHISLFGVFTSFLGAIVIQVDSIMINEFLGLSKTGIYAITFFFGTIILIPGRAIANISISLISQSWKNNNLKEIASIYQKNTITQFLIGSGILLLLWINIENLLKFLPTEYAEGKYVILFIGIQNVIEMFSGCSSHVIATSKRYRSLTYFSIIFLVSLILFNFLLIPIYGIVGAAMASGISTLLFMILRWYYVYTKFKMQPYDNKHVKIIFITFFCWGISTFIHTFELYVLDAIIRTSIVSVIFIVLTYFLKISEDINDLIEKSISFIKN